MQQEFLIEKRVEITEFPIQLESLAKNLHILVQTILQKFQFSSLWICSGLYFSSTQDTHEVFDFIENIELYFSQPTSSKVLPKTTENSYFIHSALDKILSAHDFKNYLPRFSWRFIFIEQRWRLLSYITSILVIASFSFILLQHYKNLSKIINQQNFLFFQLEKNILEASTETNTEFFSTLPAILNQFETLKSFSKKPAIFLSTTLSHQVQETEQQFLSTILIPHIQQQLENQLKDNTLDAGKRFHALYVYLMLNHSQPFNPNEVLYWLHHENSFSKSNNQTLERISRILSAYSTSHKIKLNQQAILTAQQDLLKIAPGALIFELLQEQHQDKNILLFNQQKISSYFTLEGFQEVFLKQIQQLQPYISLYNNILKTQLTISSDQLKSQVINHYFKNYVHQWQITLANLIQPSKSITNSIITEINQINYLQKLLAQLSLIANDNLMPNKFITATANSALEDHLLNQLILIAVKETIGQQFAYLSSWINSSNTSSPLQILQISLQSLSQFFHSLTPQSAFALAQGVMQHKSNNPLEQIHELTTRQQSPFNALLDIIYNQGYEIIFNQTSQYINSQWQSIVLPNWKTNIEGKYPIDKNGAQEITLDNFKSFFGNNGILDHFYNQYLAVFIDTQGSHWTFKTYANQQLKLSNTLLLNLERARIIREMFFPNQSTHYAVHFSIVPQAIQPVLMSVDLNINGQTLISHPNSDSGAQFSWPGPFNSSESSVVFYSVDQKTAMSNTKGPWSLFKLLDQAMLETTNDPEKFRITFEMNQMAAKYDLTASNSINPFIPGIIQGFECTANILG